MKPQNAQNALSTQKTIGSFQCRNGGGINSQQTNADLIILIDAGARGDLQQIDWQIISSMMFDSRHSVRAIAKRINASPSTVQTHIEKIRTLLSSRNKRLTKKTRK